MCGEDAGGYHYTGFGIIHHGFSVFCPFSYYCYFTALRTYLPLISTEGQIFSLQGLYTNTAGPWRFCISKRRNGCGINSLYYRTEEKQETEWMSGESAFVGGKRARTYGALFRLRPGAETVAMREKRREKYPVSDPFFQIVSHIALVGPTRENVTSEARRGEFFPTFTVCFAREDIRKGRILQY